MLCGTCGTARSTCCSPSTCSTRASTCRVDTSCFLRPTESATVFLQQLGRGLRRAHDKPVLTVLDFDRPAPQGVPLRPALPGPDRASRARARRTRSSRASRSCPSGCQIVLDRRAQQLVLDNVRTQLQPSTEADLVDELRSHGDSTLAEFLRRVRRRARRRRRGRTGRGPRCAATPACRRRRRAGRERALLRRVRRSPTSTTRSGPGLSTLLADRRAGLRRAHRPRAGLARMLFFSLWPDSGGFTTRRRGARRAAAAPGGAR